MTTLPRLPHLGDPASALAIAQRAELHVPAYRSLASASPPSIAFDRRPVLDKSTLIAAHPLRDLLADDARESFVIIASSGSGGRPVFWPQLRSSARRLVPALTGYLESGFDIRTRPTLAVVGLALGSWIGGDYFSWALKNVAAAAPYPFAVITPGSRHEEVLRILAEADDLFEQILLVVCPSAIGHLHLLASSLGLPLPHAKLRYLVLGEPFPESMRSHLRALSGSLCPILSVYGSADTGLLGAECPSTAALRSLLAADPALAASLGLQGPTPHLFHAAAPDAFLECVNAELVVTRWQGAPLVRYNLHDRAELLSWSAVQAAVATAPPPASDLLAPLHALLLRADPNLPDLIAISGRADRCLILCGTNITEAMLDEACAALAPSGLCTGAYAASITYDHARQRIAITLETTAPTPPAPEQDAALYARLVQALCRVQPEFHDDWRNVYARWDASPADRILRLDYAPWPAISRRPDGQIKARGILA